LAATGPYFRVTHEKAQLAAATRRGTRCRGKKRRSNDSGANQVDQSHDRANEALEGAEKLGLRGRDP